MQATRRTGPETGSKSRLASGLGRAVLALAIAAPLAGTAAAANTSAPGAAPAVAPPVYGDVSLYRQLMELNGTSHNVRVIMTNTRKGVLDVIVAEKGALTAADQTRFDAQADAAFATLTEQVLNLIASEQAPLFTDAEIRSLVAANTGPAAAGYNAAKFREQENSAAEVQSYMVESVVEIIRNFQAATDVPPGAITPDDVPTAQALRLMDIDGTSAIVRHFVGQVHMPMILQEVAKYIEVGTLSADDTVRLARLSETSKQKLASRILLRNARNYGQALSATDLATLITANDTEAQRKLTRMRIEDGGATDARSEELMKAAVNELAGAFGVTD